MERIICIYFCILHVYNINHKQPRAFKAFPHYFPSTTTLLRRNVRNFLTTFYIYFKANALQSRSCRRTPFSLREDHSGLPRHSVASRICFNMNMDPVVTFRFNDITSDWEVASSITVDEHSSLCDSSTSSSRSEREFSPGAVLTPPVSLSHIYHINCIQSVFILSSYRTQMLARQSGITNQKETHVFPYQQLFSLRQI